MSKNKNTTDIKIVHTERHAQELKALYKISRILTEGTQQKQALAEVLDVLHCDLGMSRGTIVLLSPDSSQLSVEIAHNISDRQKRTARFKMGEGVTERVVQTGKPMVVPKVYRYHLIICAFFARRFAQGNINRYMPMIYKNNKNHLTFRLLLYINIVIK